MAASTEALLETIAGLASDIARQCPDCAERALGIVDLVRQVGSVTLDRGAIQDAVESDGLDESLSDVSDRTRTEAVIQATKID